MRVAGSALIGLSIAVALFLLMSQLIAGDNDVANRDNVALNLNFIRLNLDEIENIRRRSAPQIPEPVKPPEAPPLVADMRPDTNTESSFAEIDGSLFGDNDMDLGSGIGMGRFTGGVSPGDLTNDGDLYPILQVTPVYPASARLAKQFGWVDLQYTVLTDGSVIDPVVIDSKVEQRYASSVQSRISQTIFNQAAIDAILRTRFKPRVIDGEPVPVRVTQRFAFNVID